MAGFTRMQMFERLARGAAGEPAGRRQPLSDVFPGTPTKDNITGTAGDDTMRGQSGDDVLQGMGGADDIDGGSGDDKLYGGDGNDEIVDGESGGFDRIDGGGDNDTIKSLGGNDTIKGGFGADRIEVSGQPIPLVYGNEGDDLIILGNANVTNNVYGDVGTDTLKLGLGAIVGPSFRARQQGFEVLDAGAVNGTTNADILDFSGLSSVQANVTFFGDLGDDEIVGMDQGDTISGGGGRDRLRGLGGGDLIFGDNDRDSLFGGDGDDTLDGGAEDDRLEGGKGNDVLVINGTAVGEAGPGDDYYDIGNASVLSNAVLGGAGRDTMEVGGNTTFQAPVFDFGKLDLEVLVPTSAIVAFGGIAHKLNFFKADIAPGFTGANIIGDTQADTITGTRWADTLVGGGGPDQLATGGGADSAFGGASDDLLLIMPDMGLAANGLLFNGEAGVDTLSWRLFRSNVTFSLANSGLQNTGVGMVTGQNLEGLVGGIGDDVFVGNDLGNLFTGGLGRDTITLGLGADWLIWDDRDSLARKPDYVVNLQPGDTIDISPTDADVTTPGDQAFILRDSGFSGVPGDAYMEHYDSLFDRTRFLMDVNGDGQADYTVHFKGNHEDHDDMVM